MEFTYVSIIVYASCILRHIYFFISYSLVFTNAIFVTIFL